MLVSINRDTPKSSIFIRCSMKQTIQLFSGTSNVWKAPYEVTILHHWIDHQPFFIINPLTRNIHLDHPPDTSQRFHGPLKKSVSNHPSPKEPPARSAHARYALRHPSAGCHSRSFDLEKKGRKNSAVDRNISHGKMVISWDFTGFHGIS